MGNHTESQRLQEVRDNKKTWKKWGPYLSERQWGIAQAMHLFATVTPEQVLKGGKKVYFEKQSAQPAK